MGRRTDLPEFRSRQIKNQRRLSEHRNGIGRFFRQSLRRSFPGFPLARKYGFRIGIFQNNPARRGKKGGMALRRVEGLYIRFSPTTFSAVPYALSACPRKETAPFRLKAGPADLIVDGFKLFGQSIPPVACRVGIGASL